MYLLRLDDASEYWNKENWHRMHDLLSWYSISPIVAMIPQNEDPARAASPDPSYDVTIRDWIASGWTPALHGFNHKMHPFDTACLNPVNNFSEFVGLSLAEQRKKIGEGYSLLAKKCIFPEIFVAPAHTFDQNTVEALRAETDIRIISDTVAHDVYYQDGFYYIPQQSGRVRSLPFRTTTFCYHPNTMDEAQFSELERFIKKHTDRFASFEQIQLKKRKKTLADHCLSFIYFHR